MVDIEEIKPQIVERLKVLDPDKIILFGSYAYGTPNEESDIDLFLVKNSNNNMREYNLKARKQLRELIFKYKIGFDVLSASDEFIKNRDDYFYKVDILEKGNVIYAK
jgi:predicted nucleotidyltransferase